MKFNLIKCGGVKWTDEIFSLGIVIWECPFQIDLNMGFFKITFGGAE